MQSGCGRRECSDRATAASILLGRAPGGSAPKPRQGAVEPRLRRQNTCARRIGTGWPRRPGGSGRNLKSLVRPWAGRAKILG
jgi:hypothetical protein